MPGWIANTLGWLDQELGPEIDRAASATGGVAPIGPMGLWVPGRLVAGENDLYGQVAAAISPWVGPFADSVAAGLIAQQPLLAIAVVTDPQDFSGWGQRVAQLAQSLGGQPQTQQQQAQQRPGARPGTGAISGVPSGVDSNAVAAVIRAAQDTGVDPRLALAIAYTESGLNPGAQGDYEGGSPTSFGLFQLHIGGELDSSGLSPDQAMSDPYSNAHVALTRVAEIAREHPDWSPGQIAITAQGADPSTGYVDKINNYFDQIQTGNGALGWANTVLQNPQTYPLSTGAPANQPGGSENVPVPFPSSYFQTPSLSFGQYWQGETEQGVDYPMPEGTPIVTPAGGTIELQDDDGRNWGKRVLVHLPNGWTIGVGHMMDFTVQSGQTVAHGQVLGTSGGGPQSPSPGFSSGPHIEFQMYDPAGRPQDPAPFLAQVFQGTTFAQWGNGMFVSSAQTQATEPTQALALTPDRRLIDYNSPEGQWYKMVDSAWQAIYGQHAPLQAALDFRTAGITTVPQLQDAINLLPSSIPGVSIGQYKNISNTAQTEAQNAFGRPIPQSLIQTFAQQGITTTHDIKAWFETHDSSYIPQGDYQAIFDSATAYTQSLYGDVPHPSDISSVYQSMYGYGQGPAPMSNYIGPGQSPGPVGGTPGLKLNPGTGGQ